MSDESLTLKEWHQKQAVDNFNGTWDLIDKQNRTKEDEIKMIHMAHASRYHWGEIGTALELARGEWQISRVYSLLGMAESALYHAKISLALCQENNIGDFDLAFAYEALTRAYSIGKDKDNMEDNYKKALNASSQIKDNNDKEYLISELKTII